MLAMNTRTPKLKMQVHLALLKKKKKGGILRCESNKIYTSMQYVRKYNELVKEIKGDLNEWREHTIFMDQMIQKSKYLSFLN